MGTPVFAACSSQNAITTAEISIIIRLKQKNHVRHPVKAIERRAVNGALIFGGVEHETIRP
jgi:hypothetical protein